MASNINNATSTTEDFSRLRKIKETFRSSNQIRKRKLIKRSTHANIDSHRRKLIRTRYYFTSGHEHLGKARNVNIEQSPFEFPSCSQMFAYFQYWKAQRREAVKARHISNHTKQESIRYPRSDILRRLRIDVAAEIKEKKKHKELREIFAITDVNPEYFTETAGGLIKEKFSLCQYIEDLREILRNKLLTGEQRDLCIHIEQQFDEERRKLSKIKRQYRTYASIFENFLSKDHEESMTIVNKAEKELKLTSTINEKRILLTKECGQIRLDLYYWEEQWRLVKTCQRFLFQISPISWRHEYDWIYRSQSRESIYFGTTEDIFRHYKMAEEVASLESLINMFEEDLIGAGPADLYFDDPSDLLHVFKAIELQNLNSLIHLESTEAPLVKMMISLTEVENRIEHEFDEIINNVEELEDLIYKTEKRASNLHKYANYLLQDVFRDLVCSEDILCIYIFIEDAYETCIAPNSAKLNSFTMIKLIEKTHEKLNLELDTLPHEIVKKCEKEGFKQELKAIKEAEDAARKFDLMLRLLDSLIRIMQRPIITRRQLKWRSEPIFEKTKRVASYADPTEEEMLYLTFFTNYCKRDDFTKYRTRFPDDFDLTFKVKKQEIPEYASEIIN
ncbi:coiled-coil domain-containing protein 38-like [Vespula squamosa]|uniref:Coiled-coil domain-containing protein 38-like n=1 Tax=Vespula squamosa TaxID=30214 RepID=A0ABD2AX20_VESSQ